MSSKRKISKVLTTLVEDNIFSNSDSDDVIETINACSKESPITNAAALAALGETLRKTLIEIHNERERNRERRHKELLDLLTKLLVNNDDNSSEAMDTAKCCTDNQNQLPGLTEQCIIEPIDTKIPWIDSTVNESVQEIEPESLQIKILDDPMTLRTQMSDFKPEDRVKILPSDSGPRNLKDAKTELHEMRAQMLEMQRKKMEKRLERRKRESSSKQSS